MTKMMVHKRTSKGWECMSTVQSVSEASGRCYYVPQWGLFVWDSERKGYTRLGEDPPTVVYPQLPGNEPRVSVISLYPDGGVDTESLSRKEIPFRGEPLSRFWVSPGGSLWGKYEGSWYLMRTSDNTDGVPWEVLLKSYNMSGV